MIKPLTIQVKKKNTFLMKKNTIFDDWMNDSAHV